MLHTIKKALGLEKEILLSLLHTFPHWHSRYGEETGFDRKINGRTPTKIHAIKSSVFFWEEACRKLATGRYSVRIVYLEDTPKGKVYYPICRCKSLHIQKACRSNDPDWLLVEGKLVSIDKVAFNEGLIREDFMQFLDRMDGREFCIVHFTEFRY